MSNQLSHLGAPGAVLERLSLASIAQSPDDMTQLYTEDAVHEFPFSSPGLPTRLTGRDAILEFVVGGWESGPLQYERYETLSSYVTDDPGTIVVHQDVHGTSSTTGRFVLPNLMILTVTGDRIDHLRDFVNVLAAFDAMGVTR